jgi:hypothetical protein
MSNTLTTNTYTPYSSINGAYSGNIYAMTAQGGYLINQHFDTIKLSAIKAVNQYDVTNSVQVLIDVNLFNSKIGTFNNGRYSNDTITLTASEFARNVTSSSQVISVGAYSSLYSNFISYVNTYFNYANGFTSLFNNQAQFDYNAGVFDASGFVNIIHSTIPDASGGYISALTGTIQIYNVNNIINYAVQYNVFGNRSTDPADFGNTLSSGFMDGDMIIIPQGTSATLTLVVDITSTGISAASVNQQSSSINAYNNPLFNVSSSAALNNVTQTVKAPLLIRMTDFTL